LPDPAWGTTLLAGLKHLNRLEQVLARAEWQDSEHAEGLMRDRQGG
jgi:4-amino-4-deoxychorismate lyase